MYKLRIKGLVALTNHLREDLSGPLDREELEHCRKRAMDAIRVVDEAMAKHRMNASGLPPPTRKAYLYLRSIDFDRIATKAVAPTPTPAPAPSKPADGPPASSQRLRFPGMRKHLEAVLIALGSSDPDRFEEGRFRVREYSLYMEQSIQQRQTQPHQLSDETRQIRGWLAFFAQAANLDRYREAVQRAHKAFEAMANMAKMAQPPGAAVSIHFRPMERYMYKTKRVGTGLLVSLPAPMVCLSEQQFRHLAGLCLRRHQNKAAIHQAMISEQYQDIRAEIQILGGIVERSAGIAHDLTESFERVNRAYFDSAMERPHLTWNQTLTHRKFGHYDSIRDTVMVSSSLDHPQIPAYAVDFVVYHELLHKHFGIRWDKQRARTHTPEFKRAEQRFALYRQAERLLSELARNLSSG